MLQIPHQTPTGDMVVLNLVTASITPLVRATLTGPIAQQIHTGLAWKYAVAMIPTMDMIRITTSQ